MYRRDALKRMLALTGGVMLGADFFVTGRARTDKKTTIVFADGDLALMDEIGDTIMPATDTPGAKAAGIGAFMALVVKDCYDDEHQAVFARGLGKIEEASQARFGRKFTECGADERTALLEDLDREQHAYASQKAATDPAHYFTLMKELTFVGYFSSEIGCTQALRYIETPGSYQGDVPYRPGEKAWFDPTVRER